MPSVVPSSKPRCDDGVIAVDLSPESRFLSFPESKRGRCVTHNDCSCGRCEEQRSKLEGMRLATAAVVATLTVE
jgi:hypothetical protein